MADKNPWVGAATFGTKALHEEAMLSKTPGIRALRQPSLANGLHTGLNLMPPSGAHPLHSGTWRYQGQKSWDELSLASMPCLTQRVSPKGQKEETTHHLQQSTS